jgi:hypothetical protein
MKLVKGSDLSKKLQAEVKGAFVHRLTVENGYPQHNPCKATIEAISDSEWLANTAFWVTVTGKLSRKHKHCEPAYLVTK